jgi:hypothetical protein
LIKIEIVGTGFVGQREPNLQAFELSSENRNAPDDRAFGRTGVILATEIGQVRVDDILASPNPGPAVVDARQEGAAVRDPGPSISGLPSGRPALLNRGRDA